MNPAKVQPRTQAIAFARPPGAERPGRHLDTYFHGSLNDVCAAIVCFVCINPIDIYNIQPRGKQCSVMRSSAILTA